MAVKKPDFEGRIATCSIFMAGDGTSQVSFTLVGIEDEFVIPAGTSFRLMAGEVVRGHGERDNIGILEVVGNDGVVTFRWEDYGAL
jgi:hypothetical protein